MANSHVSVLVRVTSLLAALTAGGVVWAQGQPQVAEVALPSGGRAVVERTTAGEGSSRTFLRLLDQSATAGESDGGTSDIAQQGCDHLDFDSSTLNDGPSCCSGWTIIDDPNEVYRVARKWTATQSGNSCEIDLVLCHVTGPNSYRVSIYNDLSGVPGRVLAYANIQSRNYFGFSANMQPVIIGVPVHEGITYWLAVEAVGGGQTWGSLNDVSNEAHGPEAFYDTTGAWHARSDVDTNWLVYTTSGPAPVMLTRTAGSCPGTMEFTVDNATPGGKVTLVYAATLGSYEIQGGRCDGTTLGLGTTDLRILGTLRADDRGRAVFTGYAGQFAYYHILQALDGTTCRTSPTLLIY